MHVAYMAWHALHAHGRECCYMGHMGQHEQHDHQHDAMWNFLRRQKRCEEREEYMIWRGGSGGHRVLGGLGYPALPSCLRSPRLVRQAAASVPRRAVRQAAASVPRRAEAGGRADGRSRAGGRARAGGRGRPGRDTRLSRTPRGDPTVALQSFTSHVQRRQDWRWAPWPASLGAPSRVGAPAFLVARAAPGSESLYL
jgi:hypothetical protein